MRSLFPRFLISALLCCSAVASAAPVVLFTQGPFSLTDAGTALQADSSYSPLAQNFSVAAGSTLEQIVVWGVTDPAPQPDPDNFEIMLGASSLGVLGIVTELDGVLTKYTIDVVDTVLTVSSLTMRNNAPSFSWFWASADGAPYISDDLFLAAFSLIGSPAAADLPEPNALLLLGVAGAGAAFASRRRNTAG